MTDRRVLVKKRLYKKAHYNSEEKGTKIMTLKELRKKYLPALLLAILVPAMFVACSSDEEEPPPPPEETSAGGDTGGGTDEEAREACERMDTQQAKQECLDELENEL